MTKKKVMRMGNNRERDRNGIELCNEILLNEIYG